jgi:hypothetical protein
VREKPIRKRCLFEKNKHSKKEGKMRRYIEGG